LKAKTSLGRGWTHQGQTFQSGTLAHPDCCTFLLRLFENSHNVHLYMKLLTIFHSNGFWITASPTMSSFEEETAMSSAHRAIMSLDKKMVWTQ